MTAHIRDKGRRISGSQLYLPTAPRLLASTHEQLQAAFDHDADSGSSAKRYTVTVRDPEKGRGNPGPAVTGDALGIDETNKLRLIAWKGKGNDH